jgi:sugar lactone lactonase YvrE
MMLNRCVVAKMACAWLLATAIVAAGVCTARADMTLTSAGQAQNLSLTTFATGFPSSGGVGPLGIAFVPGGGVLVSDYPGNVRLFATDTDGQNAANAPIAQNYGGANAIDMAQVNGKIYMTRQGTGDLVQINNNGTFNQVIATGLPSATGLVTDPANGHLFVSTIGNNTVWDVDPIAKTKTAFISQSADGLSMSGDGNVLYAEVGSHILGFNTTTKAKVFDSGSIPGGADGTAVGAGLFAGYIFANTNSGQLYEINLSTSVQTLIATGGSRGDFVTVDPSNDTLLITQTDRVLRLNGASFVPEPGSVALLATGAIGLLALGRRRLHRPAQR